MKQLLLLFLIIAATQVTYGQKKSLKLTHKSFQEEYVIKKPIVITNKTSGKKPILFLPTQPNFIWKRTISTTHYHNNHPANPLCFNQTDGWEMIQVKPLEHQVLYDAAAITGGLLIGGLLEVLSNQ